MNERIHRYLDGELPLEELTPDEKALAASLRETIEGAVHASTSEPSPDLTGAVMARIEAAGSPSWAHAQSTAPAADSSPASLFRWFWEPRTVRFRPAYGIMAAAAVLAVAIVAPGDTPTPPSATGEAWMAGQTAEAAVVYVQFRLDAPEASSVRLAGSFTEWEPQYSLHQAAPGTWAVLVPLRPGVHDYSFVVDGREWRPDPTAPRVDDGFGGQNSRVAVLSPPYNSL